MRSPFLPMTGVITGLLVLACGGGGDVAVPPTPQAPPPVPAGPSFETAGTFCKSVDKDDNCLDSTSTFPASIGEIWFNYDTNEAEPDDRFKFTWIAVDVGTVAPKGTEVASIDQVKFDPEALKQGGPYTLSSNVTMPTDFPLGDYAIEVHRNGEPFVRNTFVVK